MSELIWILLVGTAAGWIAGQTRKGSGFGLLGSITIGICGAGIGNYLFRALELDGWFGALDSFVMALVGAFILLAILDVLSNLWR